MNFHSHLWAIVGADGAQKFETILLDANVHLYVVGYVTQGAVFALNGTDKTPGTIDTWTETDCSGDAPSAVMLFFWAKLHPTFNYGARKHGATEDIKPVPSDWEGWIFVACDSGQKVDLYSGILYTAGYYSMSLIGYATWAGA